MTMELQVGLEVECEINRETDIQVGYYHQGITTDEYWKAENDGSVNVTQPNFKSCEFVSKIMTVKDVKKALASIKKRVGDKTDTMKNLRINQSCGAHIHFSVKDTRVLRTGRVVEKQYILYRKLPLKAMEQIRNSTMARVKEELPHLHETFKAHYFRSFAKRMTKESYNNSNDRYQEFNFTTGKAAEWRSFHLHGVRKWSELEQMYAIAIDELEKVLLKELGKKWAFKMSGYVKDKPKPKVKKINTIAVLVRRRA
jgi:hypothetical protein